MSSSGSLINYGSYIIQRGPLSTYDLNGLKYPTSSSMTPITDGTNMNDTCVLYNQCNSCKCQSAKNINPESSLFNGATCAFYTTSGKDNNACNDEHKYTLLCAQACNKSCPFVSDTKLKPVMGYTARTPVLQQSVTNRCGEHHDNNDLTNCMPNTTDQKNMFQQCIYDTSLFNAASVSDFDTFKTFSGRNYDDIMVHWCAGNITQNGQNSCALNPLNKSMDTTCPRMKSIGQENAKCVEWINSKDGLGTKLQYLDAVGSLYCSLPENKDKGSCMCINRGYDQNYVISKQTAPYNDGCWFRPCIPSYAPDYFFIPSDCQTSLNSSMCPSDVCTNIVNLSGSDTTVISNNKIYTNCQY